MAHYAKVVNNIVTQVIVAEPEFFDTFVDSSPGVWLQTSYNTLAGQHLTGGTPLRFNFAGVGFTYDSIKDAFIPQQPYPSWILNEETCIWQPPITYPDDGADYQWNEEAQQWEINS